jgi:hypothetical protein
MPELELRARLIWCRLWNPSDCDCGVWNRAFKGPFPERAARPHVRNSKKPER